jgi:elongation factor 1-beta
MDKIRVSWLRNYNLPLPALQTPEYPLRMQEMRIQGAVSMGNVEMIIKIMPESPDVDLAAMTATIREQVPQTRDVQEEPIGFGLSALKVLVVVPDEAGRTDEVEATLNAIDGVESVEVIHTSLS